VLGAWGASQRKKGKGKAGSSGAGGGPSTKVVAVVGSSGQGSSSQGSSHPSAPPACIIDLSTEEIAVQLAEAASDTQQTEPEPQPAGGSTKKDKERLRKERQRQRKIEEASEALDRAMALLARTGGSVKAAEEAMQAAAKHDGRSEPLAALVVEAKGMLEQARAAEAERARVAAEEAAVKAAVRRLLRRRMLQSAHSWRRD
jgi:hypothetical protein